jgi:predicted AlkP superfamily pyrophosphatase or phosphodiesterase
MKKKISLGLGIAALFVVLAGLAALFLFKKEDTSHYPRVVILGLDGIGWNFLNPLLKEGKLPHFQSLIDEGSCGTLQTITPTKSSVIWTSIATGISMVKHGIVD